MPSTFSHGPFRNMIVWGGPITSLAWLFFLVSPVRSLLASPHSIKFTLVLLVQLAIFVALYCVLLMWNTYSGADLHPANRHRDIALLVLMTLITVSVSLMAGPNWVEGLYFTSAAVGCKLPTKWALASMSLLECIAIPLTVAVGGSWVDVGQTVIFVGVIGLITSGTCQLIIFIRELEEARKQVARLAVSEERLRMARDLHDLLGHSLSLIAVKSELAKQLVRVDTEQAADEIGDIERVSRNALADVRNAVRGYRQLSLVQELAASEEILSAANIHAEVIVSSLGIHPTVESVLAWTIREGTTNVVRHSRARKCIITIDKSDKSVQCVIRNDDKGSGAPRADHDTPSLGNGLTGLAERVRAVQGEMKATVLAEGGFQLSVSVPMEYHTLVRGDIQ